MYIAGIKDETREALVGNRLMLILVFIVYAAINTVLGRFYIGFIFLPVFMAGFYLLHKVFLQEKSINIENLFHFFKDLNHALKLLGVYLLVTLFVAIGLALLIVPGIILGLQYSQALYIMADNKEMTVWEALERSKELMHGHKGEFFKVILTIFGHLLLGIITLGIYLVYIIPYINCLLVNYYLHLSYQDKYVIS